MLIYEEKFVRIILRPNSQYMLKLHFCWKYLHDIVKLNFIALENDKYFEGRKHVTKIYGLLTNFCVKGVHMISERAIPKIYWSAESPDFLINPVKTQNKSCQTYKVETEKQINPAKSQNKFPSEFSSSTQKSHQTGSLSKSPDLQ